MIVLGALLCIALAAAPVRMVYTTTLSDGASVRMIDLDFYPGSNMTQIHGPRVDIDRITCSPIGMIGDMLGYQCVASPDSVVLTHTDIACKNDTTCSRLGHCSTVFIDHHLYYRAASLSAEADAFNGFRAIPTRVVLEEKYHPLQGNIILIILVCTIILGMIPCIDSCVQYRTALLKRNALLAQALCAPAPAPVAEPPSTEAWRKWRRALKRAYK
jgi:hypothetical protein